MALTKFSDYVFKVFKSSIIICLGFTLLTTCGFNCSGNNNTMTEQMKSNSLTKAQIMATFDANSGNTIESYLDVSDYRVQAIQIHLTNLSSAFNESENDIANLTFWATKEMAEKGLNYSNIEILVIADKAVEVHKKTGITYQQFLAGVITMTTK